MYLKVLIPISAPPVKTVTAMQTRSVLLSHFKRHEVRSTLNLQINVSVPAGNMENNIEMSTTERPLNYITITFWLHFIQNYFKTEECHFVWAHNLNLPHVQEHGSTNHPHNTYDSSTESSKWKENQAVAQIKKTRKDKKKMLTEITGLLLSNQTPCLSPGFNQYVINRVLFPFHPFMH